MVSGSVTKLTNFGVFVELEPGLEGLLHISELADHKVDRPEDVVKLGDVIEVTVLRIDRGERKIGLSRKKLHESRDDRGERRRPRPRPAARRARRRSRAASAAAARCSASGREPAPPSPSRTTSKGDRPHPAHRKPEPTRLDLEARRLFFADRGVPGSEADRAADLAEIRGFS